jgi:hypothetical protein
MSDIVTSQVFTDGEKGITATKMNNIISQSVIQPDFVLNKPTSSTLDPTDQLLELKSTNAYARITGSQLITSVSGQVNITSQFGALRLRSFNAIGNPNFEVDQANTGTFVSNISSSRIADRWFSGKAGSVTGTLNSQNQPGLINVPGTNFAISSRYQSIAVGTTQATLGAVDYAFFSQTIEGPLWRELANDVHSISILAQSSNVAPYTFAVSLRDNPPTKSLVVLCTITAVATWQLFTLPNLPIFPAGNFTTAPGSIGYTLGICIACGTTYQAPATGTWQNGNFIGAAGMTNGLAAANNFNLAFSQHEPGAVCTTLIDKPFSGPNGSLEACQRYYQKTYDYANKAGTVTNNGMLIIPGFGSQSPLGPVPFLKRMAKPPTMTAYSPSTGAANNLRDLTANIDKAVTGAWSIGESGISGWNITSANTGNYFGAFHYTADTGW